MKVKISKEIDYIHEIEQTVLCMHEFYKAMPTSRNYDNHLALRSQLGPKAKSIDLFNRFFDLLKDYGPNSTDAIKLALNCVNDILNVLPIFNNKEEILFWVEVKAELEKL